MPSDNRPSHDLIVLSDLHLGEGCPGDSGRYAPREDFFSDEAFARLLDHLHGKYADDPARLVLVLNGDIFDFLTSTTVPDPEACESLPFEVSAGEKKFGLDPSPDKSVYKLDLIVSGHLLFFQALARFVGTGHSVHILRGNHDLELYFEEVQERLLEHLTLFEGGPTLEEARERIQFHQWFYIEPDRLYIEHGNQYEASNSIRYPLNPLLPNDSGILLDYPLGSIFVRYFYNRVRSVEPYAPRVVSFEQYLEFLHPFNILDLFRIARDHYPFFLAALGPEIVEGRIGPSSRKDAEQEAAFGALEETTEPPDLYRSIDGLKVHPMKASKLVFMKELAKPIVKRILLAAGMGLVGLYVWLVVFNLIQNATWLAENVFVQSMLLFLFSVVTVLALLWGIDFLEEKLRGRKDLRVETCAERADRIANLTGVRLVLMGHTHTVDLRKIADGNATYANSGTWTVVNNPWDRLVPETRRHTFLYVQGNEVRLCRWNDDAERIDRVPLFLFDEDRTREGCADDRFKQAPRLGHRGGHRKRWRATETPGRM